MPMRGSGRKVVAFLISLLFLWPPAAGAQISQFNWQHVPVQSGEIANIVVSPTNPDIMFLGVEVNAHSIYKSKDGGMSWKLVHGYDHVKDVAIHPEDSNIVLYADSQSIWRSTSGGEGFPHTFDLGQGQYPPGEKPSFERVLDNRNAAGPSETSFSSVVFAPSNPNIVYASVRGSGSGGQFGGRGGRMFVSSDAGATFKELDGEYPTLLVLMVDPHNGERIFAGSDSGIYESVNGGKTFTQTKKVDHVADLKTIDGQTILAASLTGILRSEDGGKIWTTVTQGLQAKEVLRVGLVANEPKVAWATTLVGVARSTDGGNTWHDVSYPSTSSGLQAKNFQALAVHPNNPNLAIVASETFVFSVRSSNRLFSEGQYYRQGIFRTEDAGQTWASSSKGLEEDRLIDVTAHPTRPYEVWVAQQASRGLYRSRDAGQTWSLSPHLLTHYPMRTVIFPDNDNAVAHTSLHIGEDFGISQDSGTNWSIHSEETFFKSLGRGQTLLSTDQSLVDRANLHLHGLAIDPDNADIIYVGSVDDPSRNNEKALKGSHIFKSTDGGKIWAESDAGYDHEYATSINDIKIDPQNTAVIYIGTTKKESTNGNGVWKSTDAGATWVRSSQGMSDNTSVSTLIIHPQKTNQLLAATFEGLYRSEDGGGSWVLIKPGQFKDIEFDPANPEIVYTGSGMEFLSGPPGAKDTGEEGVFMSNNFGKTWANITGNLPVAKISTIGINSNGKILYAGVEGYGLYVVVDSVVSHIPIDQKVGVEKGENSSRGANNHQNSPFASDPGQGPPPLVVFSMIIGVITVALAIVVVLVVWLNRRNKNIPDNS